MATGNRRGPRPGSKPTVGDLLRDGPRLHCYPNGLYVIQYVGINGRGRQAMLATKLGRWTQEAAEDALAKFKERQAAKPGLPVVIPPKRGPGRPRNGHATEPIVPRRLPRDTSKAVLGLVATHLLNTLAHTVKLLQDADAADD